MTISLGNAANRPAEVADHLPVIHLARFDRPAACLDIGPEDLVEAADAAKVLCILAEPPGPDARPGQVLRGVADVGKFPVEHAAQAVATDHDIANAEVAMDKNRIGAGRRVGSKPAQ